MTPFLFFIITICTAYLFVLALIDDKPVIAKIFAFIAAILIIVSSLCLLDNNTLVTRHIVDYHQHRIVPEYRIIDQDTTIIYRYHD